MTRFPDGFLWGAATAAHQVEGGNVSCDLWPMEWTEPSMFAEPSGDACDHYHRYPQDIATLAELGLTAYRFGVEWARVEPEEGWFSRAELDHYRRMCTTCHDHGVTPIITYNHFTTPLWFAADGGWGNPSAPDRFARYAERVTRHLGDLVGWACTLNEPNLGALLQHTGEIPTSGDEGTTLATLARPMLEAAARRAGVDADRFRPWIFAEGDQLRSAAAAHRVAFDAIKSVEPDLPVGWTLALVDIQSTEDGGVPAAAARRAAAEVWLEVSRADDFVGVQTYSRRRIGADGRPIDPPDSAETMQTGWEIYPEALGHTVRLASEFTGVPILVTENGCATDDDDQRIAYTRAALDGVARCLDDGIDVRAYLHWSLLDNFEWISGYAKTFGLIAVDQQSFERTVKPSARWLGRVARANALVD
jgi:beta-glucosidase